MTRPDLRTYWINSQQHPDFAWACPSCFPLTPANRMFTTFRLVHLQKVR
ncbi:hypothetical protein OHT52_08885 [Streptomyces sp. NBC_00247]|nr:hypothetical protein [Streptomyces sp. NBC_00247]